MSITSRTLRDFGLRSLAHGRVGLNIFNASTFAVDSLLRDYPFQKPLVRYYDPADKFEKRRKVERELRLLDWLKKLTIAVFGEEASILLESGFSSYVEEIAGVISRQLAKWNNEYNLNSKLKVMKKLINFKLILPSMLVLVKIVSVFLLSLYYYPLELITKVKTPLATNKVKMSEHIRSWILGDLQRPKRVGGTNN